jgi:hypothetical protein
MPAEILLKLTQGDPSETFSDFIERDDPNVVVIGDVATGESTHLTNYFGVEQEGHEPQEYTVLDSLDGTRTALFVLAGDKIDPQNFLKPESVDTLRDRVSLLRPGEYTIRNFAGAGGRHLGKLMVRNTFGE